MDDRQLHDHVMKLERHFVLKDDLFFVALLKLCQIEEGVVTLVCAFVTSFFKTFDFVCCFSTTYSLLPSTISNRSCGNFKRGFEKKTSCL